MEKKVQLVLGTMTFGEQIFGGEVKEMVDTFLTSGYRELDTAYVYNEGECERLLGDALKERDRNSYEIATKVNPRITGRLDKDAVLTQANESLSRLGIKRVDTLYLHFPDPNTPIESALEGCAQLYDENKFERLGLSNFPAWLVAEVYRICEKNGWMLPKVYEGLYNPLGRFAERELNQALDYYDICFYAYNPLAGGMLTDKYSGKDRTLKAGRFINRPNYQQRYWKDSYFKAVDRIKEVCAEYNINIVEASYRWLAYHSMLKAERGDAIIVGASRISQLRQNMETIRKGELPDKVVSSIEEAWEVCRPDAPEYFKYYSPKK
ncbi:aldo/keto reductase [Mediterraneibacter glycyrrhizinilyticus]|nr:aldo/keto reductase [Mediterraneibacter glycyrrhizinilyticus]MBM6853242.1 aldo/keto reductase [Mediterraneibacter glycyrrhizinilyticus]